VTFSHNGTGTLGDVKNGMPRKYGMIRVDDMAAHPELIQFAADIKAQTKACGASYVTDDSTYHPCCYDVSTTQEGEFGTTRQTEMQRFETAGVTTIIWPGGIEPLYTAHASKLQYHPEWVLIGDGEADGNTDGGSQDSAQEPDAWTVSTMHEVIATPDEYCYRAIEQANPAIADSDNYIACKMYEDIREMFIGIQVAGPRLTPQSIDKGYHAIPHVQSTNPRAPSCFYEQGDYTCIKDAIAEWWNASGKDQVGDTGCWMMTLGGRRFLPNQWPNPGQDVSGMGVPLDANGNTTDFCNSFTIA
jgi:hypothetical protein